MALFGEKEVPKQKQILLNQTFHCEPPKFGNFEQVSPYKWDDTAKKCEEGGICMWQLSGRFCKEPFCETESVELDPPKCHKQCNSFKQHPDKYELLR